MAGSHTGPPAVGVLLLAEWATVDDCRNLFLSFPRHAHFSPGTYNWKFLVLKHG